MSILCTQDIGQRQTQQKKTPHKTKKLSNTDQTKISYWISGAYANVVVKPFKKVLP
jgi:hypothetical protein